MQNACVAIASARGASALRNAVALVPVGAGLRMGAAATVLLTVAIAVSWVGVAQLARLAELAPGCNHGAPALALSGVGGLGSHSCAHLIVWLNGSSWILLGLPWLLKRMCTGRSRMRRARSRPLPQTDPHDDKKVQPNHLVDMWKEESSTDEEDFDIDHGDVKPYRWRHVALFFALALGTNYSYIAALEFIPASLNTAVFSTSPLLTLALSVLFLAEDLTSPCTRWISVAMSIGGVVLIAQPWKAAGVSPGSGAGSGSGDTVAEHLADARLTGSVLSLAAAAGTAAYQVTFKRIMGQRLSSPTQLGLFMAKLGSQIFAVYGAALWASVLLGQYRLDFELVPYSLLVGTALASLLFNFIIKFGLSISSPVVVSLATQLGKSHGTLTGSSFICHSPVSFPYTLISLSSHRPLQSSWRTGIPLNLMIDVVFDPTRSANTLDSLAVGGVTLMLVSFALGTIADITRGEQAATGQHSSGRPWRRTCFGGCLVVLLSCCLVGCLVVLSMRLGAWDVLRRSTTDASVDDDGSRGRSPAVLP